MSEMNQVVITGMGVATPIGVGIQPFWDSIISGRSGVRIREELRQHPWPLKLYAPVEDFDGRQWVRPRKSLKVMCKPIQLGFAAATMAIEQSGLTDSGISAERLGTVFGSETFFADPVEVAAVFRKCVYDKNYDHDRWGELAMREIQPLWMLKYLPNMVTSHISIFADARGPSNSICQGDVSAMLAVIEGADLIKRGVCDAVIVGGTGSQTNLSSMLYRGQDELSRKIDCPELACRPFDAERDGTVFGEGAGALVLENERHALARQAKTFGRVVGWSRTHSQGKFGTDHFRDSLEYAMRAVKQQFEHPGQTVDHINAHGLGCVDSDCDEAQVIDRVFPEVAVTALKSYFGNLGPGSPVIELIGSLIGLDQRKIPPILNYRNSDPNCPVNAITDLQPTSQLDFVKPAFSSNGQIVVLAVSSSD